MREESILIIDFGSQYNQLIARRVRECKVYSEIHPHSIQTEKLKKLRPKGIILSGGPSSVYEKDAPKPNPAIFDLGIPILGICYGMQIMGLMLKGKVGPTERKEFGRTELRVDKPGILFDGLNPQLICWMSHGDSIEKLPEGFTLFGSTENTRFAAAADSLKDQNLFILNERVNLMDILGSGDACCERLFPRIPPL